MEKELKEKIKDLVEREQRLSKEYEIYKYDLEASEPIQRNVNKIHSELEDEVNKIKQELEEKTKKVNQEIEEKENTAQMRIKELNNKEKDGLARLEREYEIYKHNLEASEPIKRNIDKIRGKLEEETNQILSKLKEETKQLEENLKADRENVLKELEETGINLEEFGLIEPKVEIKEEKEENNNKEVKQEENKVENKNKQHTKNTTNNTITGNSSNKVKSHTSNSRNETEKVKSITINEGMGIIYVTNEKEEKTEISLKEVLECKKTMFKRLDIGTMCREITEGEISGLLLKTKVNPAIVSALQNNPREIRRYIYSLYEGTELQFELTHDLSNSKLKLFDKMKMWICARAENKIPGTKITFAKLWNKNKAIDQTTQAKTESTNTLEDYKVDNRDNKVEEQAKENVKQQEAKLQEERAKIVNEMLNEKEHE